MRADIGRGWKITHLADRVIELRKDSVEYRRFVGHDGLIRLRAEPGMDRGTLLQRAIEHAERSDAKLSGLVAKQMMPTGKQFADFRAKSRAIAHGCHTGEESFEIGVKRV